MANPDKIVVGIRNSKLSQIQTQEFIALAQKNIVGINQNSFQIKFIKTTGDIYNLERLDKIGGKGLFVKEIESHILNGEIDVGVHSMKDMPVTSYDELEIFCFMERLDNSDVLVSNKGIKFENLESGSVVGTSSIRRRAQILSIRSDLNIKLLRGNVDTRIKKLKNKEYDAIILAYAGLKRLSMENEITEILDQQIFLPAGGQGTVGIQSSKKSNLKNIFKPINNVNSQLTNIAERDFLRTINANCNSPVGVKAEIIKENIKINCQILSHDGKLLFNHSLIDKKNKFNKIGNNLGTIAVEELGQNKINKLDEFKDDFNYTP